MTREQTISNLKKLKSFHNGSYGADIDRAIEALEQEPCDDEIHIGDEIIYNVERYIVINVAKHENSIVITNETNTIVTDVVNVKKTGRKYPIADMLEGLKNGETTMTLSVMMDIYNINADRSATGTNGNR